MALAPGTRLGAYEIVGLIGAGGMGEVYRARDSRLGREVAIKSLPDAFRADPERAARFAREAKVLATLNHVGIATIHGLEDTGGDQFIVMELVEGETLADRIARGPLPLDEALPIARQIAEALGAAHEQGIIHRDLKPANIKLRPDGAVKILDFGLAKAFAGDASISAAGALTNSPTLTSPVGITGVGVLLGTAAYMSPEQARGKAVDRRADIWAFGCVLYEMLSGRPAFDDEDVSMTLSRVLQRDPAFEFPVSVAAPVKQTIALCLKKDPNLRLHDMADVRLALDGHFEVPSPVVRGAVRPMWRRLLPSGAAAAVGATIVGVALWPHGRPEPAGVTRFEHRLPEGVTFRSTGRPALAVSPDGRHLVYNTTAGLFMRSLDEDESAARLLPGTTQNLTNPFFSADGQSVGYYQQGQLKRLALSGGAPVTIGPAQNPFGVTWTADDTILFGQREGLMRVSASGGTPELLVPSTAGQQIDSPQMLPEGEFVMFSVTDIANPPGNAPGDQWNLAEVVVHSLRTGERKTLIKGGSDARYVPGYLVYALRDGLFARRFDAKSRELSGAAISLVQGVQRSCCGTNVTGSAQYSVSRDGTLFYVVGEPASGGSRLAWVDRAGRSEQLTTVPAGNFSSPRLSADNQRVLVVSQRNLRIYDLSTGRESLVTTDGTVENYADWMPGEQAVAYSSTRGGQVVNVWVQRLDGSGTSTQVTALTNEAHFDSWAPNGKTLALHQHQQTTADGRLLIMPMGDGTSAEPLAFLPNASAYMSDIVFSPDGRYVAFVSNETGIRQIYIRPFPGPGVQTPVSVGGGVEPAWARNGELFYRRETDYTMMAVSVRTTPTLAVSPAKELFRGAAYPGGSPRARYAVATDGQRFLMNVSLLADAPGSTGAERRPRINVVLNWREELRRLVPTN
jgi:serine/threonine-protein kinase